MPENVRPPRNLHQDQAANLGTRAIMHVIDDLAKAKGLVGWRVASL
jgi:hypothetical protein